MNRRLTLQTRCLAIRGLHQQLWKCLVERAMGIENTAGGHQAFGIMKLEARRVLRAIFV
jgi:hypothetical protein